MQRENQNVCGGEIGVNPASLHENPSFAGVPPPSTRADLVKKCIIEPMARMGAVKSDLGLAIETSGTYGSVALGRGDTVCGIHEFATPRAHAVDFLPAIARLCREQGIKPADLAFVFLSIGPGSFTGLRIGVTAARMMALSTQARIIGVPTLEVIAQNANLVPNPPESVAVILDAKRQRVYAAFFRHVSGVFRSDSAAEEVEPAAFLAVLPQGCAVLGTGVTVHREAVHRCELNVLPEEFHRARAETVYALGLHKARNAEDIDPKMLVPDYVRRPEAEERWEQRRADAPKA